MQSEKRVDHNNCSGITLKYVGDMLKLHFLQLLLWNKSQVKEKYKVLFNSDKCKHVDLTGNPETDEFEKHLIIQIGFINPVVLPSI